MTCANETLLCGNVKTGPTWPPPLSGKCQAVMENLTVNLTHGRSKGKIHAPDWFPDPDPAFDFGIQKRQMES